MKKIKCKIVIVMHGFFNTSKLLNKNNKKITSIILMLAVVFNVLVENKAFSYDVNGYTQTLNSIQQPQPSINQQYVPNNNQSQYNQYNQPIQQQSNTQQYTNQQQYSVLDQNINDANIFSAQTLYINPYIFAGYSGANTKLKNSNGIDYHSLNGMRNGFVIGAGTYVNNWLFGASFNYLTSSVNTFMNSNVDKAKMDLMVFGLDVGLKMNLNRSKTLSILLLTGMDVVVNSIKFTFNSNLNRPVGLENRFSTSFGLNVGLGLEIALSQRIALQGTCKRIFVLSSSIGKDIWLGNLTLVFKLY